MSIDRLITELTEAEGFRTMPCRRSGGYWTAGMSDTHYIGTPEQIVALFEYGSTL